MRPLVALLCCAWLGIAAPATWAGPSREARAEAVRLADELPRLARKGAWTGVERGYLQLLALERDGQAVSHDAHVLGAQAARARGDVYETWLRLQRALAVENDLDTRTWLATLEATHGRVVIEVSTLARGEVTLESLDPISDPDAARTVARAATELSERRRFDGLLPLGRYRVGSAGFDVYGGPTVALSVGPTQLRAPEAAPPSPTLTWVATTLPEDPAARDAAARAARDAASAVPGVRSAESRPAPPLRRYAELSEEALDVLGITTTGVARAVRAQLGLPDTAVTVQPTAIGVPPTVTPEALATVSLDLDDGGRVNVGAIARSLRDAPDHTVAPAGLVVQVAPDASPADVRAAVDRALADAAPSLALVAE